MHDERVGPNAEAAGGSGDIDRTVRRHGNPRRRVTARTSPLPVPDETSVGPELDDQGPDVDKAMNGHLGGARHVDRTVRGDRHPATRVHDFAG